MEAAKESAPTTGGIAAQLRRLTAAEVAQGHAALRRAKALGAAMQANRDGQRLPDSAALLREEREERASRL